MSVESISFMFFTTALINERKHMRLTTNGIPSECLWISALAESEKIGVGLPAIAL